MTVHFLHVGKTGGTAVKRALRQAGLPDTPYGPIELHRHRFRMQDVPPDDFVMFCVRDPIARYLSGFHSRLKKGQPRYHSEWTARERVAFEEFPTPQRLAVALISDDRGERKRAKAAMRAIRHLRFMERQVGTPEELAARLDHIVYIGRTETLDVDWVQMRPLLDLPRGARLPTDPVRAHRSDPALDTTLDPVALRALREWYEDDYRLVDYCDKVRARRGWGYGAGGQHPWSLLRRWCVAAGLAPARHGHRGAR
jgi:Sulfotransferase family